VAAASILAKVERDGLMTRLAGEHPAYGWEGNKGYGAASHRQALVERGPSPHHRLSWRLVPEPVAVQQAILSWDDAGEGAGAEWTA
jgi:ribonuclease HII